MIKHTLFVYLNQKIFIMIGSQFMNILKSKLFLIGLLNCNLINAFELTPEKEAAVFNVSIYAALITYIAAISYAVTTYLPTEEMLVKTDFPAAQAWYDAMTVKYPEANLNEKLFLQTIRKQNKKYISWCSTFNQIYFPQEALKEIEVSYQKILDGDILTDEETLALGKQEFILLHGAGHIEHNDITKRFMYMIGAFGITEAARAIYKEKTKKQSTYLDYYLELIAFSILTSIPTRFQESAADAFAYELADMNALNGGISFFENEEVDSLWNIENKELSPFIETDSIIGKLIQAYFRYIDQQELAEKKATKENFLLRWWYDYQHGPTHPGASVRAQSIRDEIARRLQQEPAQAA